MGVCETKNLYTDLYANICNYRHKRIRLIPYVAPEGIMAIKYESLQLQELNQYCSMLKGKRELRRGGELICSMLNRKKAVTRISVSNSRVTPLLNEQTQFVVMRKKYPTRTFTAEHT
jgi:hypothetical protein